MDLDGTSGQYGLTDLPLLEAAIRSSAYLQYLTFGIDLAREENEEFRALAASELLQRIEDEAESVEALVGLGAAGEEFSINIMKWGCIYFIDAGELDRIGYFLVPDAARAEALHIAECFPLADADDANPTPTKQPKSRATVRAWYTHDITAAYGHLDQPSGSVDMVVSALNLQRIRSGEVLDLAGPWVEADEGRGNGAVWRFNLRGPGSASIWLYDGEDEEPEVFEVTSMQFGDDPAIYAAPPIFED